MKIHPTIINIGALFFSVISGAGFLFASRFTVFFLIIPVLLFIRIMFNALDGMVARNLKLSSKTGNVYNEFIDRLSDVVIFSCLAFADYTDFRFAAITLVMILLNSYLGILGQASGGKREYSGIIGKADRMLYLGIISIISFFLLKSLFWLIFFVLISAGTFISIIQRFINIKKELS